MTDPTPAGQYRFQWACPACESSTLYQGAEPPDLADLLQFAKTHPCPARRDSLVLDRLQGLLSGQEWSANTLDRAAELVRSSGRPVEDLDLGGPDEEWKVGP